GLGRDFLEAVKPVSISRFESQTIRETIGRLRAQAVRQIRAEEDIKSGEGGIRDIEFLVQGLQMIHAADEPEILTGNTLAAIDRLAAAGILDEATQRELRDDYTRLRRVEHFLQVHEDRQVHALPGDRSDRAALARRLDGADADGASLDEDLARRRERIHARFRRFIEETGATSSPRSDE
ncbi:MAG: hypothetical protein ACOC2D_15855, partial [Spirochaetota bacterium]